jgi:uncharacterized protein YjbI with pentapeptide repeats
MKIFNDAPAQFAALPGRMKFPAHSLTVIIKSTFDLVPNGVAKAAAKQIFPTGDEFYPGDDEMKGSVRYESDFAHWKPKADLLLVGKCHAPGGKQTPQSWVTFRVAGVSSSLSVFGDRCWTRSFGVLWQPSPPKPFTEMDLAYENSFGGDDFKDNPSGKGHGKEEEDDGSTTRPLPNVEDPQHLIESKGQRPAPVGFGPLKKTWPLRKAKVGTYKKKWFKERWPWFAEDFDWTHNNAAPPRLQMDGYLKGDEKLFFENLHPKHAQYHSQLPGLRMRCFLSESTNDGKESVIFREVPLNLDTLWVDMEAEKLVLVWRGVADVKSDEHEEIQSAFIVAEKLAEAAQTAAHYEKHFKDKLAATAKVEAVEPEKPPATAKTAPVDQELAKAEAEVRAAMIAAGIDPDKPLPPPSEKTKAAEARILKELGLLEKEKAPPMTRESIKARLSRKEAFAGEDLSGLDLSGLDMKGANFQKAILAGARLGMSDFSGANLAKANLAGSDCAGARMEGAALKDADLTGANLAGANLTGAMLEGAIFEKSKLMDAVLDRAKAKDAVFLEADLTKASLRDAELPGADFSKAVLNEAVFRGAKMPGASVAGAVGMQINMEEADLAGLRAAAGANFSRGLFRRAKGPQSIWTKTNLEGADFSFAEMEGADFTGALMHKALLYGADMRTAKFRKADLKEAKFVSMNLFQGSLEKADLTRTDFRGANLYGVEFLNSIQQDTEFEFANLKMTKLAR